MLERATLGKWNQTGVNTPENSQQATKMAHHWNFRYATTILSIQTSEITNPIEFDDDLEIDKIRVLYYLSWEITRQTCVLTIVEIRPLLFEIYHL